MAKLVPVTLTGSMVLVLGLANVHWMLRCPWGRERLGRGGGTRATYEAGIESRFILSLRGPITHIGRLGISGTLQVAIADARNSSPRDPSDLRRHVDEILTTMNSVSRPHGSIRGTLRYYPPKAGGALGPQQARSYAEIRRTNIL